MGACRCSCAGWRRLGRAVICLQELKAPDVRFPIREIEKTGYGAIWHGEKSQNGVAIISREPIEPAEVCPATLMTTKAAISFAKVASLSLLGANPPGGLGGSRPQISTCSATDAPWCRRNTNGGPSAPCRRDHLQLRASLTIRRRHMSRPECGTQATRGCVEGRR